MWIGYPWAHAQVLPWQITLGGGDHQWEAYARALMRERGVAGPLRLRLEAGRHGRARLAFGIDAGLLDALERMASAGGWRLWSCHDLLSSCLARYRAALRDSGGLVLAETGALSCLWRSAQGWEDLITLRRDPGQSLETLLSAAELLCGRVGGNGYRWSSLCAPDALPLPDASRWLGAPHPMLAVAA